MIGSGRGGAGRVTVVGGGLAGGEAAWQAAEAGLDVVLHEMRPLVASGAHRSDWLAELVCFNGFGPRAVAPDALKDPQGRIIARAELRRMGSMLMACLDECMMDGGRTFRVDKRRFGELVTQRLLAHPRIELRREATTCRRPTSTTSSRWCRTCSSSRTVRTGRSSRTSRGCARS